MSTLASTLAMLLGGPSTPSPPPDPDVPPTPQTLIGGKADHVTAALNRLPAQFNTKPKIRAMLTAFANPAVTIENALFQLLTQRAIDTSEGVQLDAIGEIVGQPRAGLIDNQYRLYLRARIATNKSRGTVEDLIRIATLILDDATITVRIETIGPASVEMQLLGAAITNTRAGIMISFLHDAVAAGVRLDLISSPGEVDDTFTTAGVLFSNGEDLNVLTIAGTTTGTGSTDGSTPAGTARTDLASEWPPSGTLVIDPGLATEQTVAYTSWLPICNGQGIRFTLAAMQSGHTAGAQICLAGHGWGDANDVGQPNLVPYTDVGTTGGRMADVRE